MAPITGGAHAAAPKRVLVVDDDRPLRLALSGVLEGAGYQVVQATDGPSALDIVARETPDVMLLDVGLPGMNGLDVLARTAALPSPPRVVVITSDDTSETLLRAVKNQAYRFVTKPFAPAAIVEVVEEVLAASPVATLPIEVVSATPEWVELVVPCALEMADRVHAYVQQLDAKLPEDVRDSVGQAFRELLCNAIEWGGGLDPSRKVRISCLRSNRMLLYRIADPGKGFDIGAVKHAAICNPADDPLAHAMVREAQGLRPGGLGLALTRALVDELIYNEARNEVVLIKYLDGG